MWKYVLGLIMVVIGCGQQGAPLVPQGMEPGFEVRAFEEDRPLGGVPATTQNPALSNDPGPTEPALQEDSPEATEPQPNEPVQEEPEEPEEPEAEEEELEPEPDLIAQNPFPLHGEECFEPGPYPGALWEVNSPEAEGMSTQGLEEAAAFAGDNHSECMVVIRNGKLVGEWYWNGTTPQTKQKSWSVTKSYSAALTGLAISMGFIGSVHDLVAEYVPEWDVDLKNIVTLENLLSMTSGLKFGLIADNIGITLAKDMTKKVKEWPMKTFPGSLWEYNNHAVQMIEPVIRNATGMPPQDFADAHLFGPIGMDADWTEDKVGNPTMYMNVKASCRGHARMGYLFMKRGCWDGTQLIDAEFVDASLSPSSEHNPGYGYWWWLNGHFPTLDSIDFKPKEDILHPDLPHDSFCAVGLGSQVVEVIPSMDLVIVRMGPAPHENLSLWSTQGAVLDALLEDGKQIVHNGIVNRVVEAIVD